MQRFESFEIHDLPIDEVMTLGVSGMDHERGSCVGARVDWRQELRARGIAGCNIPGGRCLIHGEPQRSVRLDVVELEILGS